MNQSFLFFELIGIFIVHWLILEPQTYVVVEQFQVVKRSTYDLYFSTSCFHQISDNFNYYFPPIFHMGKENI